MPNGVLACEGLIAKEGTEPLVLVFVLLDLLLVSLELLAGRYKVVSQEGSLTCLLLVLGREREALEEIPRDFDAWLLWMSFLHEAGKL